MDYDLVSDAIDVLYSVCSEMYNAEAHWPTYYPKGGKDGDVWEQACMTVLLLHGAPRPYAGFHPDPDPEGEIERRRKYIERNDWIMEVEQTLTERFRLHPGHIGVFIAAFEKWYSLQEDEHV